MNAFFGTFHLIARSMHITLVWQKNQMKYATLWNILQVIKRGALLHNNRLTFIFIIEIYLKYYQLWFVKKQCHTILVILLLSSTSCFYSNAISATTFANEYQLKAVFLYNFANFINWPNTAFTDEDSPFLICILGDDPFQEELDITIEDQEARGRTLEVVRFKTFDKVSACHILFISESQQFSLAEIYRFTCQYPILTVSESDYFIDYGGMIRFYNVNQRVRLEINPDAVEQTGLKADANLLNLSKITRSPLAVCPEQ